MIPQRIELKGFLCYKDEQEVHFDSGATLWMLSGLNGSGKSSIFDAVTYALFGHHRGGSQHAIELINKDSDGLAIEFDFRLDNHIHRIRRTLRRAARGSPTSTQQIYRYEAKEGKNPWVAVEGTNYKTEFVKWIDEKIGLTYETFTSSVLLLQGKADKLLDSKPEGRRAVLASIVDLERYERLHGLADEKRKALRGKMESLSDRLAATPEVKAEQVAEAEENIRTAEEIRQQAGAEVDRLRETELQARGWMDLQGKLATAQQRRQRAEQLLEDSAAIERAVERLRDLRDVLPRLREIVKQRGTIRDAEIKSKGFLHEKDKASEQFARLESALHQEREKRAVLLKQIDEAERRQRELAPQLLDATVQMEKLREYERQSSELGAIQKELALLPADAAEEVNRTRVLYEKLAMLTQLIPQLTHFRAYREDLRQAVGREQAAKQRLAQVEAHGKQLNGELKRLEPLVQAADRAARQAKDDETEARTLLKQAQDSLQEITQMHGSKVCRHCGLELTPGHLQDEKRRRDNEVRRIEERLKKAVTDLAAAREEEKHLRKEEKGTQENYREAREDYREAQTQMQQALADVTRLQGDCARAYAELPEEQQRRISRTPPADWLKTDYPGPQDLESLRTEAAGHTAARQRWQKAEDTLKQWNKLKTQEGDKLATLSRLQADLPADREAVRRKHADLKLNLDTFERDLKTKRAQDKAAGADIDRLTRERQQEQTHLDRINLELKNKELESQYARQAIAANQKALPASWQTAAESIGSAEYNLWDQERADLEASGTDQRGKELQQASLNLHMLRQEVESLEEQQQTFPEAARRNPAEVKAELDRAKQTEALRDKALTETRQQLALLQGYRKQREQIGEEFTRLEGEWKQQKTLAELLGRDRLQLHLVRQAERQVIEYANAVLDRLSGGQLYLKLSGEANGEGNAAKALELEAYNRSTGEKPINVAFLSGSQKFRVAVSLALGIGQYASRQHRPIESVIIDEGFGCLDSQGRQVMIQELQNLRSQMRCILLVSHQEEFAEAFSDGYHFELESGATKVTRFQK
ncbi:MAG TPA: SMC family ATPase [Gemmataceae bacterium]|nr:SMC family ATPase [Gemmataceae bacterium]